MEDIMATIAVIMFMIVNLVIRFLIIMTLITLVTAMIYGTAVVNIPAGIVITLISLILIR